MTPFCTLAAIILFISISPHLSFSSEVESLNNNNGENQNRELFTEKDSESYEESFIVSSENSTYLLSNNTDNAANNESSRLASDPDPLANTTNNNGTTTTTATINNVSSTTTTILPPTQTSTVAPTPVPDPPTDPPLKWKHGVLCLCDLHKSCDWNCCCDMDCSPEEKDAFSTCEGSRLHDSKDPGQRENSCFKSYIFYKHNTPYFLERSKSGLFCIVKDNNREETQLQISQSTLQNRIRKAKPKYSWTSRAPESSYAHSKPYKYGSTVWSAKRKEHTEIRERSPFNLPASYQGKLCSLKEPVKFLQDSSASCVVPIKNFENACIHLNRLNANDYIQNSFIVRNPANTDDASEIEIKKAVCHYDNQVETQCENVTKISTPTVDNSSPVCKNVLQKMNITVFHNGSKGIIDVIAKVVLKDFELTAKEILQEFSVHFIGINTINVSKEDINATEWPRSGNPGYIIGKPVIMGVKFQSKDSSDGENSKISEIENVSQKNSSQEQIKLENDNSDPVISLSNSPSQWMTILNPGDCDLNFEHPKRRSVLFGSSHSSTCRLKASTQKYCVDLQLMIGRILLDVENPENFMKQPKYVASFGNPNPFILSDWVPVELENYSFNTLPKSRSEQPMSSQLVESGCDNIVSMLHIQIAFAHVGPIDFPQAKILNVLYEFGEPNSIPKKTLCKTNCKSDDEVFIHVKTVVTFIDVPTRPITKVAKWPIVSVKLPSDFFYPFSSPSLSSASRISNLCIVRLLVFSSLIQKIVNHFLY